MLETWLSFASAIEIRKVEEYKATNVSGINDFFLIIIIIMYKIIIIIIIIIKRRICIKYS